MKKNPLYRVMISAAALATTCLATSSCTPRTQSATSTAQEDEQLMLVGTYTDAGAEGIYSLRFNQQDASWQLLDSAQLSNPSFLAIDSRRNLIYAVSENGGPTDALNLLSLTPATGAMQLLVSQLTQSAAPCYVSFGPSNTATTPSSLATETSCSPATETPRMAVTANYTGGSLSLFPLDEQGYPQPLDTLFMGQTNLHDPVRQEAPHVHCAHFAPDGRYLFATDFSSDRLLRFRVQIEPQAASNTSDSQAKNTTSEPQAASPEAETCKPSRLLSGPEVAATLPEGSGPRHLTFSPDARHAYLITELSGMVHVFDYQPESGTLTLKQTIETDSVHARGSAHIQLSPDGRFLYATNRLEHEGVALFAVNPDNGLLTPAGYQLTGRHPRHFNLTPNGRYLLVACRDSHAIEIYLRNPDTGALTPTGKSIPLSKPGDVGWYNQE